MHSFISTIEHDINSKLKTNELKVVRVNSILSNSEPKILQKLCEVLKLKENQRQFYTLDMVDVIKQYLKENP